MPKAKKAAEPKKTAKKAGYEITLHIAELSYTGKGDSIVEALNNLPFPELPELGGTFTVTHDGETRDVPLLLRPFQIRQVQADATQRELLAQRFEILR